MAWYRSGTLSVTNGSTSVTGAGTSWIAGAGIGEALYAPDGRIYEIANISSNTSLTLATAYLGTTQSAQSYTIIPSQSYIRDLAADAAALISQYAGIASGAGAGKFTDGTVSTPGIAFASDVDTGIYHPATNTLGIAAGGINQMQVGTAGVNIGTLSANPVISAGTANGVTYLNASKQLTSGSALTFDGTNFKNAGAVVSGASGSAGTFTLNRSSDGNGIAVFESLAGTNDVGLRNAQGSILFSATGTEQMRLTSTGLGIGTSSPASKLNVQADDTNTIARQITISGATSSNKRLYLGFNTSTNVGAIQAYEEGFGKRDLVLQPDSGNLGLGVTPSAWHAGFKAFEVFPQTVIYGFPDEAGFGRNFYFDGGGSFRYKTNGYAFHLKITDKFIWNTAPYGIAGNVVSFTQAMTLDASGNLGVGATDPSTKLHVQMPITAAQNSVREILLRADSDGTNNSLGSLVGVTFSNRWAGQAYTAGSFARTSGVYGVNTDNGPYGRSMGLAFYTSGTDSTAAERARIDSSGNLLVGTTSALNSSRLTVWTAYAGNIAMTLMRPSSDVTGSVDLNFAQYNSSAASVNYGAVSSAITANTAGSHSGALVFQTSNAGTLAERARIDSSGNLGVGTSSPQARISAGTGTGKKILAFDSGAGTAQSGIGVDMTGEANQIALFGGLNGSSGTMISFGHLNTGTNAYNEKARIDSSGHLLVGKTTTGANDNGSMIYPTGTIGLGHSSGTVNGTAYAAFGYDNGGIGSITQSGTTSVAYNTSSDYRLKSITGPITNSGQYIDSLNPVEGTWKADGSTFVGLIAHEVQEASRTQVATGQKDGEQMQAMDYSNSELIANLIAEVKSLRARVAQLESN